MRLRCPRAIWSLVPVVVLALRCSLAYGAGDAAPPPAAPPTPPTASAAPGPAAIPVAEVATRAAQVPEQLRALTQHLASTAEIDTIRRRLHNAHEEMETELAAADIILNAQPTLDVIQSQQQRWQRRQFVNRGMKRNGGRSERKISRQQLA